MTKEKKKSSREGGINWLSYKLLVQVSLYTLEPASESSLIPLISLVGIGVHLTIQGFSQTQLSLHYMFSSFLVLVRICLIDTSKLVIVGKSSGKVGLSLVIFVWGTTKRITQIGSPPDKNINFGWWATPLTPPVAGVVLHWRQKAMPYWFCWVQFKYLGSKCSIGFVAN